MTSSITINIAQLNYLVGDIDGNFKKIIDACRKAKDENADLVVFSELALIGYPPEDLVLRVDFQEKSMEALRKLAKHTKDQPAILVGSLWVDDSKLYNSAILLADGEIKQVVHKTNLPSYGVFDEHRIFTGAKSSKPIIFKDIKIGALICADMWDSKVSEDLQKQGAEILIVLNASPFESGKHITRQMIAKYNTDALSIPLIYVNQVGGQDELVFDGGSFILGSDGQVRVCLPSFTEDCTTTSWEYIDGLLQLQDNKIQAAYDKYEQIYSALKLGLYDYTNKNNFPGVVIGMSGGIDSALSAAIAVDALGPDKVRLIMMPSKYTSTQSIKDAKDCADLLGVALEEVSIASIVDVFSDVMQPTFVGRSPDTTEENLQSRIRGNILMAISNKFGHIVLTTGNKSEMAVGYATLYGDMCGGFNILKDIYKTDVYELARWRNKINMAIPDNIITKMPTAELKPNQTDQDTLPQYDILDKILYNLIEKKQSSQQIAQENIDIELVEKITKMVKNTEYKRRQAPPGVKITQLAFGRDRRYPITNGYRF